VYVLELFDNKLDFETIYNMSIRQVSSLSKARLRLLDEKAEDQKNNLNKLNDDK
jgi:hypothetical protein